MVTDAWMVLEVLDRFRGENSVWWKVGSMIDNLRDLVIMSFSYRLWITVVLIILGARIILNYEENVSYYIGRVFSGFKLEAARWVSYYSSDDDSFHWSENTMFLESSARYGYKRCRISSLSWRIRRVWFYVFGLAWYWSVTKSLLALVTFIDRTLLELEDVQISKFTRHGIRISVFVVNNG
jgi:hypothetical protein